MIVSARTERQIEAISEQLVHDLKEQGNPPLGVEGARSGPWALVDIGDVVVHIFHHPARAHYDIEGLWIDAPRVELDVPEDAQLGTEDDYAYGS